MRTRTLAPAVALLFALAAAGRAQDDVYTLDELVATLARDPRAVEAADALLSGMGRDPRAAVLLGPDQRERLRAAVLRGLREGDVRGLERAPALRVSEMGAGAEVGVLVANPPRGPVAAAGHADLPAPRRRTTELLGIPVADRTVPAPAEGAPLGPLGELGVARGEGEVDPDRAGRWPDSSRLAEVLDRLAVNEPGAPLYQVRPAPGQAPLATPEALIAALQASGHEVRVLDRRRTANFADLTHEGRSVAAPVWVDTELPLPDGRTLVVPATHSEHQVLVRGPVVNADVAFFMGIDGQARFRPLLGAEPAWLGGRTANVYEGERAREAVRVAGEVRRAFVEKAAANPQLPWGGYYHLGVCNDSNAFVEQALTGKTTLYPLTRDPRLFAGEGEIDRLSRAMPIDGRGRPADLARVLGALPADDPSQLAFAGLRDDVRALLGVESARGADAARGAGAGRGQTQAGPGPRPQGPGIVEELPGGK